MKRYLELQTRLAIYVSNRQHPFQMVPILPLSLKLRFVPVQSWCNHILQNRLIQFHQKVEYLVILHCYWMLLLENFDSVVILFVSSLIAELMFPMCIKLANFHDKCWCVLASLIFKNFFKLFLLHEVVPKCHHWISPLSSFRVLIDNLYFWKF